GGRPQHEHVEIVAPHVRAELNGAQSPVLADQPGDWLKVVRRLEPERCGIDGAAQFARGQGLMRVGERWYGLCSRVLWLLRNGFVALWRPLKEHSDALPVLFDLARTVCQGKPDGKKLKRESESRGSRKSGGNVTSR